MRAAVLAIVAAAALACAAGGHSAGVVSCKGAQLASKFSYVPGSAGAGNVVYKLTVTNRSSQLCAVTGLPAVKLLGRTGNPLPTHVKAVFRPGLTAVLVRLAPGGSAKATARFSPDVPGPGEPVSGTRCEPVSYWVRITAPGGGVTKASIKPATPVCEHGTLQMTVYQP
jgi:Protein of unknown function (DUF4232)